MERLAPVLVGLALVAALVFVAGSIDSVMTGSGGGPDVSGGGDGLFSNRSPIDAGDGDPGGILPDWLGPILFALVVLASLVYAVTDPQQALRRILAIVSMAIVAAALFLLFQYLEGSDMGLGGGSGRGLFGSEASGGAADVSPIGLSVGLAAVLGILAVAVLLAVYFRSADADGGFESPPPEGSATPGGGAAAVARRAGAAADRIEAGDVSVSNEVYRAWVEMTGSLDVGRPSASTPGEFADAAVSAGLDRDAVEELTDLFREVRYGGVSADEDRERRAVEALRQVESSGPDAEER